MRNLGGLKPKLYSSYAFLMRTQKVGPQSFYRCQNEVSDNRNSIRFLISSQKHLHL